MKSNFKTFIAAALMLIAIPAMALAVEEKVTVIDGTVFTGTNMFSDPAEGATVDISCENNSQEVQSNSDGYFRAVFDAGDCSMGEDVTVCSGDVCDTRNLIGETTRINLLGFKLFEIPEFSAVAASLAFAGAGIGYLALRRRK